jgi:hypothetical protein
VLEQRSEPIFSGEIDTDDPVWQTVPALQELLAEATADADEDDTRIVVCDLIIRGVPVTEVDYTYRDKPHTLAIVGFDEQVEGDMTLVDTQRIMLWAVTALCLILAAVVVFLLFFS